MDRLIQQYFKEIHQSEFDTFGLVMVRRVAKCGAKTAQSYIDEWLNLGYIKSVGADSYQLADATKSELGDVA